MPSIESLTTFSGLFAFAGTLALLNGRWTIASTLFLVAGSAGLGIFWDRWSRETGEHVQVWALFAGQAPSGEQWALFATHLPMLALGLGLLIAEQRRPRGVRG